MAVGIGVGERRILALAGASAVPVAGYHGGHAPGSVEGVFAGNGSAEFTVACKRCTMRLVADRIRDAEAVAMADHLGEYHPELGLGRGAALGDVFEHYRVTRTRR